MSENYFEKRLRTTPVPPGKERKTYVVEMVLDIDTRELQDEGHLSDIATWLEGVAMYKENPADPWLTRDVTVFKKEDYSADPGPVSEGGLQH